MAVVFDPIVANISAMLRYNIHMLEYKRPFKVSVCKLLQLRSTDVSHSIKVHFLFEIPVR